MHNKKINSLFISAVTACLIFRTASAQDDIVDFSDQITPICDIAGLTVAPPEKWINVPINTEEETWKGCQMMLIIDMALVGIIRIHSYDLSNPPDDMPHWSHHLLGLESVNIAEMGYFLNDPIWQRQDVPVTGGNFRNAKAIGFDARIEDNPYAQEAHFLVFENDTHKYLVSLLTPAESVDDGSHYRINTQGMKTIIQTFQPSTISPDNQAIQKE